MRGFDNVVTLDMRCCDLLRVAPQVEAAERSGLVHRASCTVVRYYVAKYTASAAEAWARSKGATQAEIEAAGAVAD